MIKSQPPKTLPDKSAVELAKGTTNNEFLSQYVFVDLLVNDFKFGPGTSGKTGQNMISQDFHTPSATLPTMIQPVAGKGKLSIHLNCEVKVNQLRNDSITVTVKSFHITARSLPGQNTINSNGPSKFTAEKSIHMNVNTGWGDVEKLGKLADEIDVPGDQIVRELELKQGYNQAYMLVLVASFKEVVTRRIQEYLGGQVQVVWKGDKTFPL